MTIEAVLSKIAQPFPKTKPAEDKITALYLRLSNDDGAVGDSDSIVNQRAILTKYAKEHGFTNVMEFADDGYSGIDFKRPAFQKMLNLIESGQISAVIVKDMSRLGREYIQMGLFTEILFPRYEVRFIAIGDHVDSFKGENDFTALRSIFNEWHVRDTSRKVRAVKDMQARNGKRVNGCCVPYGYSYNRDTDKLIIDEETAPVVRHIFQLCKEGYGPHQIARILTSEQIPVPSIYKGYKTRRKNSSPYCWSNSTLIKMLKRKEYIGHTVFKKTYTLSYKQKKRIKNDESRQLIFYNTHEPIIDDDTFVTVQQIRKARRRSTKTGYLPVFSGLIICADCGGTSRLLEGSGGRYRYYICSSYGNWGTCTRHSVSLNFLESYVLEHIQTTLQNADSILSKQRRQNRALNRAKARLTELERLSARLYEDRIRGTITEAQFKRLNNIYNKEIANLTVSISSPEAKQTKEDGIRKFVKYAQKHKDVKSLAGGILRELVEKIVVHEKEDGEKHPQVDIYYRYIGQI